MTITSHKQLQHTISLLFAIVSQTIFTQPPISPTLFSCLLFPRHPSNTCVLQSLSPQQLAHLYQGCSVVCKYLQVFPNSSRHLTIFSALSIPKLSLGFVHFCLLLFRFGVVTLTLSHLPMSFLFARGKPGIHQVLGMLLFRHGVTLKMLRNLHLDGPALGGTRQLQGPPSPC